MGTLTTSHAPTAPSSIVMNDRVARARTASTKKAPRRNTGHSLKAAPSPKRTPAHALRCRAAAYKPATARKIAGMSQLVNAWTMTRGLAATSRMSHTRAPASRQASTMVPTHMTDIHRAVTAKYHPAAGTVAHSTKPYVARDMNPINPWNRPDKTGYSM